AIREEVFHVVLRNAVRISRVVAVTRESLKVAVIPEQTRPVRSEPQSAVSIFEDGRNPREHGAGRLRFLERIPGESIVLAVEHGECVAVEIDDPEYAAEIFVERILARGFAQRNV